NERLAELAPRFAEHDAAIAALQQEIGRREETIERLKRDASEQAGRIRGLYEEMAERESKIADLSYRLTEQAHLAAAVRDLRVRLELREMQLKRLEAHAAQQAEGIEWLRQEVALRDHRLTTVTSSRVWRAVSVYNGVRDGPKRVAETIRNAPRTVVLGVGRRGLPGPIKRLLKRIWGPPPGQPAAPGSVRPPPARALAQRVSRVDRAAP